ncbi:endo-beta-glucanase [Dendrothele bispora CBS 962.96]|uniref:Endo-beta-glucanase n=1 Tax=Dendrothele bispora (strain CBS 962.96) TaxID=1314807 RepID=A0A4S8MQ59_DENBC|nr:endo-beta-glucanase [Dendrothele bispora CBS 962.96]
MATRLVSLLCLALGFQQASAATYSRTSSREGTDFLSAFEWQAIDDPTHGRVRYVDQASALNQNLTFASGNHFILRSDYTNKLDPNGAGRDSVRIQSLHQYTTATLIFNIRHMPQGCGTWPAVWTVGANWPNQGEVDILEGVNDQGPNTATLHTSSGCTMPASRSQTGNALQNDCNVAVNSNAGCGVRFTDSRSYGPTFNANGGGWYAMERRNTGIKVWFWSRNDGSVPAEVRNGATTINTSNWGTPVAFFPDTSCDIASKFGPHKIVINLTFCGDFAGAVYGQSGCPSTCNDFVNNNPSAFMDAYFDFEWLRVYQ